MFGPPPQPRVIACTSCQGCGGTDFSDFPETLLATFNWPSDVSPIVSATATMHRKLTEVHGGGCTPDKEQYSSVSYHSDLVVLTPLAIVDERICCVMLSLKATCSGAGVDGACAWTYIFAGEDDHYATGTITMSGYDGVTTFDVGNGDNCLEEGEHDNKIRITISEGSGSSALCEKLCCEAPNVLYVTLESDCETLDGVVIEVHRSDAQHPIQFPPAPTNPNGTIPIVWSGKKTLCDCAHFISVLVTSNTWTSTANPRCFWALSLGAGTCFNDLIEEFDMEFCPPVSFSAEFWPDKEEDTDHCSDCCPDMETITVSATVSE